jgi:ABC-type polysaccharide/polyol phosphate transport system ATPase subunit
VVRRVDVSLDPELALSIESLAKRLTDVHELRYAPTLSLATRLRQRRDGVAGPASGAGEDGDAGDDEDEADEDDGRDGGEVAERIVPEWPLRGVSFTLARGEALGVVGDRDSIDSLTQILVRMTAPTSGRVVYSGRIGLSSEFAKILARREGGQPRQVARTLAALAGVPRRLRKAWLRDVLALMVGDAAPHGWSSDAKHLRNQLPFATALDSFADILVVDRLPGKSDPVFLARCVDRLRERVAGGASAVVAGSDLGLMAELCTDGVWIEKGEIARIGPAADVIAEFRQAMREQKLTADEANHAFNDDVSIVSAEVVSASGRPTDAVGPADELWVAVRFETAHADTSVAWRVVLRGPTTIAVAQRRPSTLPTRGSYIATLRVPPGSLGDGDYELTVEAAVVRSGKTSTLVRAAPGRLRAEGLADVGPESFDSDSLTAEWSLVDEG